MSHQGHVEAYAGERLNQLLAEAGQPELAPETLAHFATYLELLKRWNARTNLTAIRDEEGILRRHFVESIAVARALPAGIGTLLDFGSGAGFPGIPIALCRPEISVTLAESQGKKAGFLREAVRTLAITIQVHGGRAESIQTQFDCVALRAVDKMEEAIHGASGLIRAGGWLAPLTTGAESAGIRAIAGLEFAWGDPVVLPGGNDRILLLGRRSGLLEVS
jgi:16S rRNA (guanine527-N7)-methyltransferase